MFTVQYSFFYLYFIFDILSNIQKRENNIFYNYLHFAMEIKMHMSTPLEKYFESIEEMIDSINIFANS